MGDTVGERTGMLNDEAGRYLARAENIRGISKCGLDIFIPFISWSESSIASRVIILCVTTEKRMPDMNMNNMSECTARNFMFLSLFQVAFNVTSETGRFHLSRGFVYSCVGATKRVSSKGSSASTESLYIG